MDHIVKEEVRQYRLLSKSKSLARLKYANVNKISSRVDEHQLKDLVNKKVYYNQKLLKMLNNAITSDEDEEEEEEEELSVDDEKLDASVITSRYLAEKCLSIILETAASKAKLEKLLSDQTQFISEIKAHRQTLGQDEALEFDKICLIKCKQYEKSAIKVFKAVKLPFFLLKPGYNYPGLMEDKRWILGQVHQLLEPEY